MFSKLFLASVAAIDLLLAGPQKASAQVVYACVTSIGNISIVAANANCLPGATKTTLSAGFLAGRAFKCGAGNVTAGDDISFNPSMSMVSFGTSIGPTGTGPWTSFTLQPGFYLIHFSGGQGTPPNPNPDGLQIQAILNGSGQATWYDFGADAAIVGGDRLILVSAANSTLKMNSNVAATFSPQCAFLIMQVAPAPPVSP
jgi:hypothetical protein